MSDGINAQLLPISGVFRGIIKGDAMIESGSNLEVKGIVGGDLFVEPGSTVLVSGIVRGRVLGQGSDIDIRGIVGSN